MNSSQREQKHKHKLGGAYITDVYVIPFEHLGWLLSDTKVSLEHIQT